MNSLPGRNRQHQPSSLLDLPQDICIEIAVRIGATSERPLADSTAFVVLARQCAACAATVMSAGVC
jgi:hypothetical protein